MKTLGQACLSNKKERKNGNLKRKRMCNSTFLKKKKSKCVLNIVPKETKCKTFKKDKRCILKKINKHILKTFHYTQFHIFFNLSNPSIFLIYSLI